MPSTNKLEGIQINQEADANREHFFQKLRSKKILIQWEPENTGS